MLDEHAEGRSDEAESKGNEPKDIGSNSIWARGEWGRRRRYVGGINETWVDR